jgi:hypothetical protein
MHRLHLEFDDGPVGQYHNYDIDRPTFIAIATGQRVLADIDSERDWRELGDRLVYWAGVYSTETGDVVNNLTPDQAATAYDAWWREAFA